MRSCESARDEQLRHGRASAHGIENHSAREPLGLDASLTQVASRWQRREQPGGFPSANGATRDVRSADAWLLLALGTVAVATAVVGGASVSAGSAGPHANPPRVAGFDVSVTFFLNYHVEWRLKTGAQGGCSPWRDDSGTADVFAHNEGSDERPRLEPLQGRFLPSIESILPPNVPVPRGGLPRSWAELSALGPAKGSASRLWIQRGGPATTPCNGQPVSPFVSRPDDCGRREFTLPRRNAATIRAEYRTGGSALNEITRLSSTTTASDGPQPVLSVTVSMGTPFAKCALSHLARPLIASMGIPVPTDKVRALRNLGVNKTVRIVAKRAGVCDDDFPADEFGHCDYSLKGWIAIRRIQRNPHSASA